MTDEEINLIAQRAAAIVAKDMHEKMDAVLQGIAALDPMLIDGMIRTWFEVTFSTTSGAHMPSVINHHVLNSSDFRSCLKSTLGSLLNNAY